ncbi:MAG: ubiquinone/menaquinone biosynthesis methyltransferase [Gammaproteobacteria bacterium]
MRGRSTINHSRDFAGRQTTPEERDRRLAEIFERLAPRYDRLLDVQTLGLHRHWRRVLVRMMRPRPGDRILDVAGGSGEMAIRLSGADRRVIVLDRSLPMIEAGRSRTPAPVAWVAGLARTLPFRTGSMDAVVCAFGVRNVTYVEAALKESLRVLRSGGWFYCLEVSRPWAPLRPLYRGYCHYLVPRLGAWITRAPEAYDYLVESILEFPDRETIKNAMETAGFVSVHYRCLTLGVVCIHAGRKPEPGDS